MRCLVILILLLCTSCFFWPLPAPHGHSYVAIDGSERCVGVFCTPHNKTFILETKAGYDVQMCSKVMINDTCGIMEYKEFFETMAYQKHVRINDNRFHKLLETDTLAITNNLTGEKIYYISAD
ncbi:hypothetical protein [Seonamhaeicola maritimus]|uniref:hypothetical protein n=1 Tax=Seonamhaeicola maritimus TaxID=2591822 RepID=UPI0024952A19|nr:hypothetical protein [Seonamhaeicola maritimus]